MKRFSDFFQTVSREIEERQDDYEKVLELKCTILEDQQLSNPFKDNIKREGESLDQKWNELRDTVSTQSDR